MAQDILAIDAVLNLAPVAVTVGRALVSGGLPALEVTLRTARALDCIRALAALEGAIVGAGTVLDGDQAKAAADAGARFLVSPGATAQLVADAEACRVPLLPGVATASEAMVMLERGYSRLKFFPAESIGGVSHLRSLASPFPMLRFCPDRRHRARQGPCISRAAERRLRRWFLGTTADAIKARNWSEIEVLARQANSLRRQS